MKRIGIIVAICLASLVANARPSAETKALQAQLKEAKKKDKAQAAIDKLAKQEERVKAAQERLQDAQEKLAELKADAAPIAHK